MKSQLLLCAALLAANPILLAQEGEQPAEHAMPNPQHEEHELLKALVGTWDVVMKSEPMPDVPGMEEATESKGTEHTELVCNGLWAKSVINATYQGEPFQGVWLAGYDPFAEQYTGIWVSSDTQECGACTMTGTYDEGAKSWTWTGKTQHGPMRSVFVLKSDDQTVETCYMQTPDGKEVKCMEITRTRSKTPATANASAGTRDSLSEEHQQLLKDVGEWDATVKMSHGEGDPVEEKATEVVAAICGGQWLWSDFQGQLMGAPFEGHALIGYDPNAKEYVSYWIDSSSPIAARTTGQYDADKKAFTLQGSCVDPTGSPMKIKEVVTYKDADTRVLDMEFEGEAYTSQMQITYKRKS